MRGTVALAVAREATPCNAGIRWSYVGEGGPAFRGELGPTFAACAFGQQQPPIDCSRGEAAARDDLVPAADAFEPEGVRGNGHTAQVDAPAGIDMALGGETFELGQFHLHAPSEHRLDGEAPPWGSTSCTNPPTEASP